MSGASCHVYRLDPPAACAMTLLVQNQRKSGYDDFEPHTYLEMSLLTEVPTLRRPHVEFLVLNNDVPVHQPRHFSGTLAVRAAMSGMDGVEGPHVYDKKPSLS